MLNPVSPARVLLVEGQDDKHVVGHLCIRAGLQVDFCIREKTNDVELLKSIRAEGKASGRTVLGIVLDADDDPDARWDAVTARLRTLGEDGYINPTDLPAKPVPTGTIIDGKIRNRGLADA